MSKKSSYRKYAVTTIAAAAAVSAVAPVASAAETKDFTDVKPNHEFYKEIMAMAERGIVTGIGDASGRFNPEGPLFRAQAANMFVRALDLKTPSNVKEVLSVYTDVNENSEYAEEIAAVTAAGIFGQFGVDSKGNKIKGKFNSWSNINREQMASVLVRAYNLEELDTGKNVKINLKNVSPTHQGNVQTLANLGITIATDDFKPLNNVTRAQFSAFLYRSINKAEEPQEEVAIERVSAINTKTIKVDFNQEVLTNKAEFTIKKGASTIGVSKTSWNSDKTSAELEINSKLSEGTYEVSVSGLTKEPLTGSVKVENEKVTDVKILSDNLVLDRENPKKVTVGYQVLNQYGEDVTKSALPNLKVVASKGTEDADKGTLTLTAGNDYKVGDKVVVTMIDETDGVTTNKTLTVVDEAKASEVTVNGVYNKDGKALSEDTIDEDFYLLFEAKDQYGDTVDNLKHLKEDLTVLASNPGVVDKGDIVELEIDEKKKFGIKLNPDRAGKGIITIISNANGKAVNHEVEVAEGVKVDTISIGSPDGIIAGKDKVLIPVEATDNKGKAVTELKKVKDLDVNAQGGSGAKFVEKDGQLYIEVVADSVAENRVGNLVVSVTSETNKFSHKVFQVRPNAEAKMIVGLDSKVSTSILKGESVTIKNKDIRVEDQYGRAMSEDQKKDLDIEATVDSELFSVVNGKDADDNNQITVTAKSDASKAGSALITFALNSGGKEISTVDVRFSTVTQAEFKSYKVADVGTLYASETNGATNIADYGKELKVYGVTANGQEVRLPKGEYNVVSQKGFSYDKNSNKVYANNDDRVSDEKNSKLPLTADASLKVVINNTGDEVVLSGKISAEKPKAEVLEYRNKDKQAVETANIDITDSTISASDLAALANDIKLYVEDQYSVAKDAKGEGAKLKINYADGPGDYANVTFSSIVNADNATFKVHNNGEQDAFVTGLKKGATLNAKVSVNGESTTIKLTVAGTSISEEAKEEAFNNEAKTTAENDFKQAVQNAIKNDESSLDLPDEISSVSIDGQNVDIEYDATDLEEAVNALDGTGFFVNLANENVTKINVKETDYDIPAAAGAAKTAIQQALIADGNVSITFYVGYEKYNKTNDTVAVTYNFKMNKVAENTEPEA